MKTTKTGVQIPDRLYYYLLDFNDSTNKEYISKEFNKAALNELTKDEVISLTNHAMLADLSLISNDIQDEHDHYETGPYNDEVKDIQESNAQRAREDSNFQDENSTTGYESDNTGGKVKVTRYSDGSSTWHHGGPVGDSHYDENGEEC